MSGIRLNIPEYSVTWGRDERRVNLHGALLRFEKDGSVIYENPLLASGIAIIRWSSRIHLGDRAAVILPLLAEGESYDIELDAETEPRDSVFLEFDFFNKREEQIESQILHDDDTIVCPKDMYYYEIALVQGGAQKLVFHRIGITRREKKSE